MLSGICPRIQAISTSEIRVVDAECLGCCSRFSTGPTPEGRESWNEHCEACQSLIGAWRADLHERRLEAARSLLERIARDSIARQKRIDRWEAEAAKLYRESLGEPKRIDVWEIEPEQRWVPRKRKKYGRKGGRAGGRW